MSKITIEEALAFAEKHYPNAPEKLIEYLNIEVRYSPLNCDGWCLQLGDRTIIRINSTVSDARKRFTLAHELGHLIYEIPTVVGEHIFSDPKNRTAEELKVDEFAAQILLPASIVKSKIQETPITAAAIKRLAKDAKMSQLAVALRIANLTPELGFGATIVLFYENDDMKWQWSQTLNAPGDMPKKLLAKAMESNPQPARILYSNGKVSVISFLENPSLNTKTVFVQLVSEQDGFKQLPEERVRELEQKIFENDIDSRKSMAGRFGAFKKTAQSMLLEEAIDVFVSRLKKYPYPLSKDRMNKLLAEDGIEYIRLKLQSWTKS
ncbi:MAG TPA: ImmA/IrrE family metallo-endopeptidase [Pyrinomonadaceae bacterium]|jgi:Zn-dependent peptidase ImmA (M78 family)|nr:ImmA/IrrE family metallo-endopeptidase [Pyrinomonadaceae bacterium]